ncbi:MAG: helicase C-terminal domain-containing protein [Candidatus Caldarchaeum sp.]
MAGERACHTAAVWAAVRAYAEEKGLRVLWLTRTASQIAHVSSETGCFPVYGRRLLCLHETVSQVELRRFNAACRATRMSQRCVYYPGRPRVAREKTVGGLKDLGRRFTTCPYEIQAASIPSSKALAATHRQLSVIGWLLSKWRWSREKTIMVIDEAQSIIKNALEMTKDSISLKTLARAAREASRHGFREMAYRLNEAVEKYSQMVVDGETEVDDLLPDADELEAVGEEIQLAKLRDNIVPASHVLTVADFKIALGGQKPLLVREGGKVWLDALADPAKELGRVYEGWNTAVIMSATIDAELLERLTGRDVVLLRAGWPFQEDALKAYIVKGMTTRYPERDEQLYEDAAWLIRQLAGKGRLLVFTPSYEILEEVRRRCEGLPMACEASGMGQEEAEQVASDFTGGSKNILMTVFGGRMSEGVDLPADFVLLVGVPFARPTPRSRKLLQTLRTLSEDAWLHGVVLPALYTAVQAAGRAIRGSEDRAVILMADNRYPGLLKHMPRWFRERVAETLKLPDLPIMLEEAGRHG